MPAFYTFAIDEHGLGYSPQTFYNVEDAEMFLEVLKDQLEDANNSQAFMIRSAITNLEDQLLDYKELSA